MVDDKQRGHVVGIGEEADAPFLGSCPRKGTRAKRLTLELATCIAPSAMPASVPAIRATTSHCGR